MLLERRPSKKTWRISIVSPWVNMQFSVVPVMTGMFETESHGTLPGDVDVATYDCIWLAAVAK